MYVKMDTTLFKPKMFFRIKLYYFFSKFWGTNLSGGGGQLLYKKKKKKKKDECQMGVIGQFFCQMGGLHQFPPPKKKP